MAKIINSDKLKITSEFDQTKMISGPYVLLRIIHEANSYTLMTATAKEDDSSHLAYTDLSRLVDAAESVLKRGKRCVDKCGRPYFLCEGIDHPKEIRDTANEIADILGLSSVDKPWGDEEGRDIYDNFSVSEYDEPAYLSDGVYISKRGRLIVTD